MMNNPTVKFRKYCFSEMVYMRKLELTVGLIDQRPYSAKQALTPKMVTTLGLTRTKLSIFWNMAHKDSMFSLSPAARDLDTRTTRH